MRWSCFRYSRTYKEHWSVQLYTFRYENKQNLLASNSVESTSLVLNVGVEVCPELDQEESILGSLVIQLFEATLLLWELVIDLPHIHGLKHKSERDIATGVSDVRTCTHL